jgi:hypothetical protein
MNEFWHGTGLRVCGITVTQRGTLDYRRADLRRPVSICLGGGTQG